MVERYASVYYDEQLNPFGAPAPGQPKLYFADVDGKSTTMDSRRAVVPAKWRKKFEDEGGEDDTTRAAKRRRWDVGPGVDASNQQQSMLAAIPQKQQQPHMFPPPPPPPHSMHPMQMVSLVYV